MEHEDLYEALKPGGTPQELQTRAERIILAELKKPELDPLRVLLVHDLADLAIFKCNERTQKNKNSGKLRRKQTKEGKIGRRIRQRATNSVKKIRVPPEVMPWSVDKQTILDRFPDKTKQIEVVEQTAQDALSSFFPKKLEEKPDATK